jgi:hypothetical protein
MDWAFERGAEEFSVNLIRVEPGVGPSSFITAFERELGRHRLPDQSREHLESSPGEPGIRRCALWRLDVESLAVLKRQLPDGLLAPPTYSTDGWLENPRFYRGGALLLGVITHEGGAVVRPEAHEVQSLMCLPLAFRERWEWVG